MSKRTTHLTFYMAFMYLIIVASIGAVIGGFYYQDPLGALGLALLASASIGLLGVMEQESAAKSR